MMLSHLPADWWSVRRLLSLHLHQRGRETQSPSRSVIKISKKRCVFGPARLNTHNAKLQFNELLSCLKAKSYKRLGRLLVYL